MALARSTVFCQVIKSQKSSISNSKAEGEIQKVSSKVPEVSLNNSTNNGKIVLQPRVCTLRAYGSDPVGVIKTKNGGGGDGEDDEISPFFATLSEYIESSKKSQDFEIISGRLAMVKSLLHTSYLFHQIIKVGN